MLTSPTISGSEGEVYSVSKRNYTDGSRKDPNNSF